LPPVAESAVAKPGLQKTYNKHNYLTEKRAALDAYMLAKAEDPKDGGTTALPYPLIGGEEVPQTEKDRC